MNVILAIIAVIGILLLLEYFSMTPQDREDRRIAWEVYELIELIRRDYPGMGYLDPSYPPLPNAKPLIIPREYLKQYTYELYRQSSIMLFGDDVNGWKLKRSRVVIPVTIEG